MNKITTTDILNAAIKGEEIPFKDVELVFRNGLYQKINICLHAIRQPFSIEYCNFEFRVTCTAGRVLITVVAPDKDWLSILGAEKLDSTQKCGLQGVYFEDDPLNKFLIASQSLNSFEGNLQQIAVIEPRFQIC